MFQVVSMEFHVTSLLSVGRKERGDLWGGECSDWEVTGFEQGLSQAIPGVSYGGEVLQVGGRVFLNRDSSEGSSCVGCWRWLM